MLTARLKRVPQTCSFQAEFKTIKRKKRKSINKNISQIDETHTPAKMKKNQQIKKDKEIELNMLNSSLSNRSMISTDVSDSSISPKTTEFKFHFEISKAKDSEALIISEPGCKKLLKSKNLTIQIYSKIHTLKSKYYSRCKEFAGPKIHELSKISF